MKIQNKVVLLICGVILSASLVFFTKAQEQPAKAPKDWSRLRVVTFASGSMGFFDPESGKLFVYDARLENCFIIRQLSELGEPMQRLKN